MTVLEQPEEELNAVSFVGEVISLYSQISFSFISVLVI